MCAGTYHELLLSPLVVGFQLGHGVAQLPELFFEVHGSVGGVGRVSLLFLQLGLEVFILVEQPFGTHLQLVVILVHVIQSLLQVLDLKHNRTIKWVLHGMGCLFIKSTVMGQVFGPKFSKHGPNS